MKCLIAIDPGGSGGVAIMNAFGDVVCHKIPETPQDLLQLLSPAAVGQTKCYVEEVGGYISGEFQPGSAMFSFGRNFGRIEGILVGLRVPFELVKPQRWQKALALGTAGRVKGNYAGMTPDQAKAEKARVSKINYGVKRDWKNKLKEHAQRLFPRLTITLCTCDSLLILEYARRMEGIITESLDMGTTTITTKPATPQPQLL